MRLLYKRPKYLRHARSVARHIAKRRISKKKKQKNVKREKRGLSKRQVQEWNTRRRYKAVVKAPANFAFLDDPESVTTFISRLEGALEKNQSLYVEMKFVEKIDYATIAALLAVLYRSKKKGKKINGNMPAAPDARSILAKSGFIYTLFGKGPEAGHKYNISADNQLFTLDQRDLSVVKEIENMVSLGILGKSKKLPGLYMTLGELMDNTATHAAEQSGEAERWWVSINHDKKTRKVEFVFIDYGVGILRSLHNKLEEHPVKKALQRAQRAFGLEATEAHLKAIVMESAGKAFHLPDGRGEGIYGIYQAMQRGQIGNLHIISNTAFGAVSDANYKRLRTELRGTLYYWDVCVKNYE